MYLLFLNGTALHRIRRDDYSAREMHLLAEYALQELDGIVGYAWIQEFTPRHGIHYHAVFYLNAQHYRMPGKFIDALTDWWRCFTNGDGWFYDGSKRQSYHTFDGQRVLHYDDKTQQAQLQRALGYLAKKEQKDYRNYCFGLSDVQKLRPVVVIRHWHCIECDHDYSGRKYYPECHLSIYSREVHAD